MKKLKRFDRIKVISGFYQDYGGVVLHQKGFLFYAINIGGKPIYIARWHLRYLGGKVPKLATRIREKMIENDRKCQQGV